MAEPTRQVKRRAGRSVAEALDIVIKTLAEQATLMTKMAHHLESVDARLTMLESTESPTKIILTHQ